MANKSKNLFLYIIIAVLYLIHVGANVPLKFDDWLRNNPKFMYLLIGICYSLISFEYLADYEKDKKKDDEKYLRWIKYGVILLAGYVGIILILHKNRPHRFRLI